MPDAVTTPYNFQVTPDAMAQAGEHFTPLGLVRLAQVHTHGNACTRHSPTDDQRAYSQRDGALSLVLPHHAAGALRLAVAADRPRLEVVVELAIGLILRARRLTADH